MRIYYVPARKAGVSAYYRTWQPLLNEHVEQLSEAHLKLKEANESLLSLNEALRDANGRLRESNYIKE